MVGQFDAEYRFVANQRVQWRSISDNPYSTFAFSADMNKVRSIDALNAGFSFMHDIAGDGKFRTLDINGIGGYTFPLTADSAHTLTAGLGLGFVIKSINYSGLRFDAQYDGTAYNSSLATNENFVNEGRTYLNLSTGLGYKYVMAERTWATAGLAFFNLTKPKQTFFSDDDIRRDRRMLMILEGSYPVNYEIDVMPTFSFMFQGKYKELIFGSRVKYTLVNARDVYRAVYAGLYYRNQDAGYLFVGMDYDSWHAGLSYDLNLSNLNPASLRRGGWEVALIYKLRYYKYEPVTHKICPDYMR